MADATAGKKRHTLLAEQPARRLSCVARVGVLGQEHEERATRVLVQARPGAAATPAPRRVRGQVARPRRHGSARSPGARRRGCARGVGSTRLAGITPRGVIVAAAHGRPGVCGRHAPHNHPQGHPGCPEDTLSTNLRRRCDDSAQVPCQCSRTGCGERSEAPTRVREGGCAPCGRTQLKRRCVSSRPSASRHSTASAARVTIASASSSGANGDST